MRVKLPKVGDVMKLENFTERHVYAHFVSGERDIGPMIQLYIGDAPIKLPCDALLMQKPFPPVLCGIYPPVKSGEWVIAGHCTEYEFEFPQFLAGGHPREDGSRCWYLRRGTESVRLGNEVPVELRSLECDFVVGYEDVEERIRSGVNHFGYEWVMTWTPQVRVKKPAEGTGG